MLQSNKWGGMRCVKSDRLASVKLALKCGDENVECKRLTESLSRCITENVTACYSSMSRT